jgi:hypothetical protein
MKIEDMTNAQLVIEYCKCKDIVLGPRDINDVWQFNYSRNVEISREIMRRGGFMVVVSGGNLLGKGVLG